MIRDNLPSPVVARATAPESSASPAASPGATGVVSSTTVSVTGTTLSPTGLAGELKKADDLLLQKKYAEAVRVYDKLLAGSLDATQKKDVEQRLTWAKQLRDRAAVTTTTVPTLPADAAAGKTVAEGDRLLATCKFEEAAATYQALKADADRQEIAARLLALRGAAAQALSKGTLMPVVLKDNKRGTVCSIGRAAAQLADTGGAVSARRWDALDRDDIYRVYRACLPQPTPAQRLDLGLLCKALGLKTEMQAEFDQAAQDATQKPLVDRFAKVALTP
jgi:hypothetical protein